MKYILIASITFFSCNRIKTYTPTDSRKPRYHTSIPNYYMLDSCEYSKIVNDTSIMWIHDIKTCKNPKHKEINTKF